MGGRLRHCLKPWFQCGDSERNRLPLLPSVHCSLSRRVEGGRLFVLVAVGEGAGQDRSLLLRAPRGSTPSAAKTLRAARWAAFGARRSIEVSRTSAALSLGGSSSPPWSLPDAGRFPAPARHRLGPFTRKPSLRLHRDSSAPGTPTRRLQLERKGLRSPRRERRGCAAPG